VSNVLQEQKIHTVILYAQVQIQSPQRSYSSFEKERLLDLFGTPDQWGQTLRNRLWCHAQTTVPGFTGTAETILPVPCTFDLNVAATKYLYALEDGVVPLLFLFSGSVFYATPGGQLQVQRISWDTECSYEMPLSFWREIMNHHYPNTGWLYMHRDMLDRLYAYKRQHGFATWEQTIEHLLGEKL